MSYMLINISGKDSKLRSHGCINTRMYNASVNVHGVSYMILFNETAIYIDSQQQNSFLLSLVMHVFARKYVQFY